MPRGGKRPGAGRRKGSIGAYKQIRRDLQVAVRLTAEEKKELDILARGRGLSVSRYIHQELFERQKA